MVGQYGEIEKLDFNVVSYDNGNYSAIHGSGEFMNKKFLKEKRFKLLKFYMFFFLSFILLFISMGCMFITLRLYIDKHSCAGLFTKHEFTKYGTALLITEINRITVNMDELYDLWKKFGIESVIISKTALETIKDDRIQEYLIPLVKKANTYGITYGIYIDDIFYVSDNHPWYNNLSYLSKDNRLNLYQYENKRVLNILQDKVVQDLYINTFTRYLNVGFNSFIFADLPIIDPSLPPKSYINQSLIFIPFLNEIRNHLLTSQRSYKTYIGLNVEYNQSFLLNIIPNFAHFLCVTIFNDIEVYPLLDYMKLKKKIDKSQQLANTYNVPIIWMPNEIPLFKLIKKSEIMLQIHTILAYLPGGSMIHITDLLFEDKHLPIFSMISKNLSTSFYALKNILSQIRVLKYCRPHLQSFNQISSIQEKKNILSISRADKKGIIGSYLIINNSKRFFNANIRDIVYNAKDIFNITQTGNIASVTHSNLTNIFFPPYGSYLIFTI